MSQFPSNIDLSSLIGSNGFTIRGAAGDNSGWSVASAGDVNGDGIDDLIVGGPVAGPHGTLSGASYVVFGHTGGFASTINVSSLNGSNGFKLSGVAAGDNSGWSVASAGDVNGDGIDDMIVGAPGAQGSAGASYVVFGKAGGFASNIDLSSLNGSSGFKLSGAAAGDYSGVSVASAGDVNGDGFDDLIVGAKFVDMHGNDTGASYVVFGHAGGFASNINLSSLDGNNGVKLGGLPPAAHGGISVASAGDVNGDGFDDVIVGAPGVSSYGANSGASYVVFGHAGGFTAAIELPALDGSNGFRLSGGGAGNYSGRSVASAGDVNGDGFADLIVGAPYAGANNVGVAYVVFGHAGDFASDTDLSSLNGNNGFKMTGVSFIDSTGFSVASAGDVNGDGFDDLIIGAQNANGHGPGSGVTYVVFGHAGGFASNIDLSSLDGTNGFKLSGVATVDYSGHSVAAAGDVNGDGIGDLIVGAPHPNDGSPGASYIVFGRQPDAPVVRVGTDVSQTLAGGAFHDVLIGLGGDDQLYGNGGDDILDGGDGNDTLHGGDGNDVLDGGAGVDMMIGGTSNDTYYVDNPSDVVTELAGEGTDTVHTTVSYALTANVEILIADSNAGLALTGNTLDNLIIGGDGNDRINGGRGADHMQGGAGNDTYMVDNIGDVITDTSGVDTVITRIDYTLGSDIENLRAGADSGLILTGNGLANRIVGGGGNDTLTGGLGKDTLTGGGGDDVFRYLATSDSGADAGHRDTITDFSAGDKIDLSAIDAIDGGGHDTFTFIGAGRFTAAGQVRATLTAGGDTLIEANTGSTTTADFSILLQGDHTLTAADFKLT